MRNPEDTPDFMIACARAGYPIIMIDGEGVIHWADREPDANELAVIRLVMHRDRALSQIEARHAALLRGVTEHVSPEERDGWPVKSAAAIACQAGTAGEEQCGLLDMEAEARGMSREEMAVKIIARHRRWHDLLARAAALRASARIAVKSAATVEEITAALGALDAQVGAEAERAETERQEQTAQETITTITAEKGGISHA